MEHLKLLDNRYRIESQIGGGGMARIYLATDIKLKRKVAVKILHDHMAKVPEIRKRFQLEAQAISAINHPNIVKIYDYSGMDTDTAWIVTEIISGQNLGEYLELSPKGRIHPLISCCIAREISKALGAAHSKGIVHRDIKPENVMVTNAGIIRLMDFGIAKDLHQTSMTLTGTFIGSPSYMSIEQIKGKGIDTRSDLYSLAVLMYELITGELPFKGNTSHEIILKIMEAKYLQPKRIAAYIPDDLNAIITKGMSKKPFDRFQSTQELNQVLDNFLFKQGLVESHVELERYFVNPQAYEARLKSKICSEYFNLQSKLKVKVTEHNKIIKDIKNTKTALGEDEQRTVLSKDISSDLYLHQRVNPIKRKANTAGALLAIDQNKKSHLRRKRYSTSVANSANNSTFNTPQNYDYNYQRKRQTRNTLNRNSVKVRLAYQSQPKITSAFFKWMAFVFAVITLVGSGYLLELDELLNFSNSVKSKLKENIDEFSRDFNNQKSQTNSQSTAIATNGEGAHAKNGSETEAEHSIIQHKITIKTNFRPIKVSFVDTETGQSIDYIQSSYTESFLLEPGSYQLKAYFGSMVKKSKPFKLGDKERSHKYFSAMFEE